MSVASLSAGLLARKGAARPSIINAGEPHPVRGGTAPQPGPGQPQPRQSQASQAEPRPRAKPAAPPQAGPDADGAFDGVRRDRHGRVRLSLRLDPDRHRRLRLASVHLDESIQDLLTDALDQYLTGLDLHCPCVEEGRRTCETPCNETETRR